MFSTLPHLFRTISLILFSGMWKTLGIVLSPVYVFVIESYYNKLHKNLKEKKNTRCLSVKII